MSTVGSLLRALAARFHGTWGWLAYRVGCRRAARAHFERVLLLRGADFRAYVHLGRIAFDAGDYAGWRRELEHARRLDPERFARLRHPLELFEPRLAGTSLERLGDGVVDFDGTGDRATWRSLRSSNGARAARGDGADVDGSLPGLDARNLPHFSADVDRDADERDDCASADERTRFRELGPIAPAELARCDLDELLRRLSG